MRLPSNYRYFDHAAGWPVREEALAAYVTAARQYGNPGSVHQAGQRALASLDASRKQLAEAFGCEAKDIVLTGTATEADNLAVLGTVSSFRRQHPDVVPRVVISAIEHDAVRLPAEALASAGLVELAVISVDHVKGIDLKEVEANLDGRTALVSMIHVSNETGTLLPIARIGRLVRDFREDGAWPRFHADAAQALAYVEELATSHADLVTYSGYKVGAVAGCAALVCKDPSLLDPQTVGGGQEKGKRAGTEDVAAAAAFAKAARMARASVKDEAKRMADLRRMFVRELSEAAPRIEENAHELEHAPHIVSLWAHGVHAQQSLAAADLAGFAIAAGPACSARSVEPSRVIQALGYGKQRAEETVRVSFGPGTDEEGIRALVMALK